MTETWLREDRTPPGIPNYVLTTKNREHRAGGGVAIFLHDSLNFVTRSDLTSSHPALECVFVEIKNQNSKNILVGCIYHPPDTMFPEFLRELELILEKVKNSEHYDFYIDIKYMYL